MKLGFGLYRHQLTKDHYRFARQCGATHLVIHLVDYFNALEKTQKGADQPVGEGSGWGKAGKPEDPVWSPESLQRIKKEIEAEGLQWYAIENFDPGMWHDILLDGPGKQQQAEKLKTILRSMGEAGIPVMGYNFSIAGVCSRKTAPVGRGKARTVVMDEVDQTPLPKGMVWNMAYTPVVPDERLAFFSHDELWRRVQWFLETLIPVAEEAGVRLAAHPDDPPMPVVRNTPRLVYQPSYYQKLLDLKPSYYNALQYCIGSLAEMTEGDIYEYTDHYSRNKQIGYIHFRNVKGKVPRYTETFIDEGDVDMFRILRILKKNDFQGVMIPDHTPLMSCEAPWHAGMAYAMGYMQAALKVVNKMKSP